MVINFTTSSRSNICIFIICSIQAKYSWHGPVKETLFPVAPIPSHGLKKLWIYETSDQKTIFEDR